MFRAVVRTAFLLTFAGSLFGVGPVAAQREPRMEPPLIPPPQLLSRLKVTPEQQGKLDAAVQTLQTLMRKVGPQATREQRGQAVTEAQQGYREAVLTILTPEQLQQVQPILREAIRLGPLGMQVMAMDLSDAQRMKLSTIADRFEPEYAKLRTEAAGNREALRGQFEELNARRERELREVLTPDQQRRLSEPERRRNGIPGPVPPEWLEDLKATPEQRGMIAAAVRAYESEMAQTQTLGREERGEALRKAGDAYAASLRQVLTPDQQQRIGELFEEAGKLGGIGVPVYRLTLSDDQRAELRKIAARHQPEREKLQAAAAQTGNPREALRTQFEALQERITADVRSILTPEQLKRLDEAQSPRRRD